MPLQKYTLPCIHEIIPEAGRGQILEYCNTCNGEMRHVRFCNIYEKCTRTTVSNKVRSCINCAKEKDSPYKPDLSQVVNVNKKKNMRREELKQHLIAQVKEKNQTKEKGNIEVNNRQKPRMEVNKRIILKEKIEQKLNQGARQQNQSQKVSTVLSRSKLKPNELNWTCALTTVPIRRTTTLTKTLESIIQAGFPIPQLYIDVQPNKEGAYPYLPDLLKEYTTDFPNIPITLHTTNIRTFGNWYLALLETYIREPQADRYVFFQDDIILSQNVREYIEHCSYPENGYLNLITYPQNEQEKTKYKEVLKDGIGWYQSNQKGKGAQALVFDRQTVMELLKSEYLHKRIQDKNKGWQNVDGAIVTALRIRGYSEYVHSPSLVRHTGAETTMGGIGEHPQEQPLDLSFRGEEFNALDLLKDL